MRRQLVAIAAAIIVGLSVAAPPQASAQQPPLRADYSYPDYWRVNFMNACVGGDAPSAICACVLRGFEFSWPFWVAEAYDGASATPETQRTAQQIELMTAARRIVVACVRNQSAY
jgi:hypothetical protein